MMKLAFLLVLIAGAALGRELDFKSNGTTQKWVPLYLVINTGSMTNNVNNWGG